MTPEKLAQIRINVAISDANFSHRATITADESEDAIKDRAELLDHVDELTRQRDDARALAVKSGIFQNNHGTEYTDAPEPAALVEVPDWDRQ